MNTLYLIIALFALGALIGMYLLALVLQKKETPKFVAFIHGAFVASALVLLIVYNFNHPGFIEAIVLFVVAAVGGLTLIIRDLTGKSLPRWLAIGHGLIAVGGFIFLLACAFTG
jgi:branched-subunit amino acid transport protein AzlD